MLLLKKGAALDKPFVISTHSLSALSGANSRLSGAKPSSIYTDPDFSIVEASFVIAYKSITEKGFTILVVVAGEEANSTVCISTYGAGGTIIMGATGYRTNSAGHSREALLFAVSIIITLSSYDSIHTSGTSAYIDQKKKA